MMGWEGESRSQTLAEHAAEAWALGHQFFTPVLDSPVFRTGSEPITAWPTLIAGIVDAGWTLHTWAVTTNAQGRPQALPLFSR